MVIYFRDGSHADCSYCEIRDDNIYWDGYRYASLSEVESMEDSEEE